MSVKPLDLQVNIAQITNVAQQQQTAQVQPLIQQEYLGIQAQEQAKIDREKVQVTEKAEGKKIEEDTGGGTSSGYYGSQKKQQKRAGKDEEKERGKVSDPVRGHFIDITK